MGTPVLFGMGEEIPAGERKKPPAIARGRRGNVDKFLCG